MDERIIFLIIIAISILQYIQKSIKKKKEAAMQAENQKRTITSNTSEKNIHEPVSQSIEDIIRELRKESIPMISETIEEEENTEPVFEKYQPEYSETPLFSYEYQDSKKEEMNEITQTSLIIEEAQNEKPANIDFDLRRAVIYNTILERKY